MFENNGHVHVNSPGALEDNPRALFHKHKSFVNLVIFQGCLLYSLNAFLTVFPISLCRKIGQGQSRIIISIKFVELMLQYHRISDSKEILRVSPLYWHLEDL